MYLNQITAALFIFIFISCSSDSEKIEFETIDWKKKEAHNLLADSTLEKGTSYLSIYSQIYSQTDKNLKDLTVTVSMRNTSSHDTLYLQKILSFDTEGLEIKNYCQHTVYLLPMETLELVIDEKDTHNGTGGNFTFDWLISKGSSEPIFEAVMISTAGQQGLSFITTGKRTK